MILVDSSVWIDYFNGKKTSFLAYRHQSHFFVKKSRYMEACQAGVWVLLEFLQLRQGTRSIITLDNINALQYYLINDKKLCLQRNRKNI